MMGYTLPSHNFLQSEIILCMRLANERWHYIVWSSLIGWAHIQNDPCQYHYGLVTSHGTKSLPKSALTNCQLDT